MPLVSTRQGYDVRATHGANAQALKRVNGWLSYGGDEVPLWVDEITTGWSMSGSTAQSSRTRTFFPHNFQQPSFTISCQFPSQREMADVAQFVRRTHKGLEATTMLEVLGLRTGVTNGKLKGPSQNTVALGYVDNFTREHMQGVYSPEVTFNFVVQQMISPSDWSDSPVTIRRLKSWHDIVEGIMAHDPNAGFADDPDANTDNNFRPRTATDLSDASIQKRTSP